MFNFGISKESAVKTVRPQLKPWNIYDVTFVGCEVREFAGKKNPNETYKVLDIKFENEDGYFSLTNFFPKDGDDARKEFDGKNGGKVIMPSNFETLMAIVKQTAQVLNPAGFEKMQAMSSKFRSFDDVAKALIAVTEKAKGTTTKLKLNGKNKDGKIEAVIPRIVGINKEGVAFIADNYIGDKLFFSNYELDQRDAYLKAAPTDMKKKEETKKADPLMDVAETAETPEDDNLDLDTLL